MIEHPNIIICLIFTVAGMLFGFIAATVNAADSVNYWRDMYFTLLRRKEKEKNG